MTSDIPPGRRVAERDLVVWVADIGSVKAGHFAWCRMGSDKVVRTGQDIAELAAGVADDLSAGQPVALGFECPLFVPVRHQPDALSRAREVDHGHAWSAGAGCIALVLGVAESAWLFSRVGEKATVRVIPTFHWREFQAGRANLFIWEALVTGKAKGETDEEDAAIAAQSFWSRYPDIGEAANIPGEDPFSLAGAALLRSGLSTDLALLSQPCVVLRS